MRLPSSLTFPTSARGLAAAVLACVVTGCAPVVEVTPGGSPSSPEAQSPTPQSDDGDRARLLATCPAQAPSWYDEYADPHTEVAFRTRHRLRADAEYLRQLHARKAADKNPTHEEWSESWGFLMTAEEERSIWAREEAVRPALDIAAGHLATLPSDQAGTVRNDSDNGAVVVTVTRDAEQVRRDLQAKVGDKVRVKVETIRWSQAELQRIAAKVEGVKGLALTGWSADAANGRVEVSVERDVEGARKRLATIADPCAIHVEVREPATLLDLPAPAR